MILCIAANQLRSLARDGAVRAVMAGYLFALLAASLVHVASFLSAGESQVALMGDLLLQRITSAQLVFLEALTPWIVLRLRHGGSTWDLVPEPAAMAVAPWQAVLGTLAALTACLFALLSASLPVLSMIRLFGATTYREIAWSLAALLLLLVLVVLVLALRLNSRSRAVGRRERRRRRPVRPPTLGPPRPPRREGAGRPGRPARVRVQLRHAGTLPGRGG